DVCVHPGSRLQSRRWYLVRFAQVANHLAGQGLRIVLTGTKEERPLVDELSRMIKATHFNLAGQTSLGALAALLRGACLLVSNDSGVSHLASAVKTHSVV